MKLIVLLLAINLMQITASVYSQNTSFRVENTTLTLQEAIKAIESQTEYRIAYSATFVDQQTYIEFKQKEISVQSFLEGLNKEMGIGYLLLENDVIVLTNRNDKILKQEITVKGKVTDTQGNSLPGVNIVEKGTTNGAVTNLDGEYTISVGSTDAILSFSYIGFLTEEVEVNGQTSIDMILAEDITSLEEIVVVGYATQKKTSLTGSVSSLGSKDIEKRQVGQSSMLLQGLAPGVTVMQQSGEPGEDSGIIRIRGIGTLSNNDPLVLVDGVPMSMNNIDPNIIESISILKDASAAAIYGARAANGVILITTKRGSETFTINYSGYMGIQGPTNLIDRVSAADHMALLNVAYENSGRTPIFSDQLVADYDNLHQQDPLTYPDTDWFKEVYTENGLTQNHSLTFEGGSDRIKILGSLGYYDQNGNIINVGFKRYSFRLNSDVKINDKLSVNADMFLQYMDKKEPGFGTGTIIRHASRLSSIEPYINQFGQYAVPSTGSNPLALLHDGGYLNTTQPSLQMRLGFNYKFTPDLKLSFIYSPHYWFVNTKQFQTIANVYNPDGTINSPGSQTASLEQRSGNYIHNITWLTLTYGKTLGNHNINILLGGQQESNMYRWFGAYRDTYDLPRFDVLSAGDPGNQKAGGSGEDWALQSVFGRLNYDFLGKYLFEAAFRYDGSSRFAEGNRFGFFPSFSVGWRLSEEEFWSSIRNSIGNLKLRGSWGQLGNQDIGSNYPFDSFLSYKSFILNGQIVKGLTSADMANSDISWETTEMYDVGLDIGILNNISLTFDYYYKKTFDILLRLDIPSYLGQTAPYQNAGIVENKGWELQLGYNGNAGDFTYDLKFTLSDVKNKILDLKGTSIGGLRVKQEGQPFNSFFGYEAIGFFQSQDDIDQSPTQSGNNIPGSIKYKDQDDNGVIDADDRVILGDAIPRYTFGLNANLGWKGIDFNLLVQGVGKANGYIGDAIQPFNNGTTALEMHKDYWSQENTNPLFPSLAFNETNNYRTSSFWVKNAAYLRIKNMQLGYTLPAKATGLIGIQKVRIYVSGQNLLSLDDFWDGYDVEAPVGNGYYYPQQKFYLLGFNVTF